MTKKETDKTKRTPKAAPKVHQSGTSDEILGSQQLDSPVLQNLSDVENGSEVQNSKTSKEPISTESASLWAQQVPSKVASPQPFVSLSGSTGQDGLLTPTGSALAANVSGVSGAMSQIGQSALPTPVLLGQVIRARREELQEVQGRTIWSLRQVAKRLDVEPSYLSKIERSEEVPGEELLERLARDMGADKDVWMALAGRVSADLRNIIAARPQVFAALIRQLKDAPEGAILRVVREVRDGAW